MVNQWRKVLQRSKDEKDPLLWHVSDKVENHRDDEEARGTSLGIEFPSIYQLFFDSFQSLVKAKYFKEFCWLFMKFNFLFWFFEELFFIDSPFQIKASWISVKSCHFSAWLVIFPSQVYTVVALVSRALAAKTIPKFDTFGDKTLLLRLLLTTYGSTFNEGKLHFERKDSSLSKL